MQEIPDTGGGLSGFIAWLLWRVYVYFPFERTWDWLLLIVSLAVLARCLMIPVWWRLVKRTRQSKEDQATILRLVLLSDFFLPWLVIWLFNTTAGWTLLAGRSLEQPGAGVYWLSLVYHAVVVAVLGNLVDWLDRAFATAKGLSMTVAIIAMHSLIALAAHLYWHWSAASFAVFSVFGATALIHGVTIAWLTHVYHVDLEQPSSAAGTK